MQSLTYMLALTLKCEKHVSAKPLKRFKAAGVLQIVANFYGYTCVHSSRQNQRRYLRSACLSHDIAEWNSYSESLIASIQSLLRQAFEYTKYQNP